MRRKVDTLKEMEEAPLGRLLFKYSWPALVSMTLNALYAVVDRFYIGNGCGMDAMAGLTFAIPVTMVYAAFGVWIGVGHASILSIKLGEGDISTATRTLGQMVLLKILFFVVLPLLTLPFMDAILRLMGGFDVSPEALHLAKLYLYIVLPPQLFAHLAFGLSGTLRSEGAVMASMMCMVVGFGVNLVLDPLFIFTFKMGVAGAGWATDLAMVCSCLWALGYYWRGKTVLRIRWRSLRLYAGLFRRTMSLGAGPFLQQVLGALICLSLPKTLTMWSASEDEATLQVAVLGIYHAVSMLFFLPVLGLQQGVAPIMGYNWGARNFARVREALFWAFGTTTILVALASFSQLFFPRAIARAFGAEGACLVTATRVLAISNCMLWSIGVNVVATTYFQSIGRPRAAILLSVLRQGVILLPCLWILPYVMADHVLAIWLALPISDILCQLATLPPLLAHVRFLYRAGIRSRT